MASPSKSIQPSSENFIGTVRVADEILTGPLETHFIGYANRTARGGTFSDSVLLANRCSKRPNGHSDGVRIYRTYRPMNGQPMLPKWPNDGSSHTVVVVV